MSIPNPGYFRPVSDTPYMSGAPVRGVAEQALHRAMQALYCNRVNVLASECFLFPRAHRFTQASWVLLRTYLVRLSADIDMVGCVVAAWSPGVVRNAQIRLKTETIATPPVAITTSATFISGGGEDSPDLLPSNARGLPRANLIMSAAITTDTSGTRNQRVSIQVGNNADQPFPIYVQTIALFEIERVTVD